MKKTLIIALSALTATLCADGFNEENLIVGKDPFPEDESYLPEGSMQDDSDDSNNNSNGNQNKTKGKSSEKKVTPENNSSKPKGGKDVFTPEDKSAKTKAN